MSGPTLSPRELQHAVLNALKAIKLSGLVRRKALTAIWPLIEQIQQQLTEAEARLASQQEELTDWILVADGLKHDWRCQHGIGPHNVVDPVCLRCRLEEATARLASQGEQIAQWEARALDAEGRIANALA